MRKLVLLGAGGHAKVVAGIARRAGWELIGVLDDGRTAGEPFQQVPVLGPLAQASQLSAEVQLFVALGDNATRARLYRQLRAAGRSLPALVDPEAQLSGVQPGSGTVVMAGALVLHDAYVGENCILNTRCLVGPECRLADHVHLCPGSVLEARVQVGEQTMVGTGSVVLEGLKLGEHCRIGAGSLLDQDVAAGSQGYGRPFRARN